MPRFQFGSLSAGRKRQYYVMHPCLYEQVRARLARRSLQVSEPA